MRVNFTFYEVLAIIFLLLSLFAVPFHFLDAPVLALTGIGFAVLDRTV